MERCNVPAGAGKGLQDGAEARLGVELSVSIPLASDAASKFVEDGQEFDP